MHHITDDAELVKVASSSLSTKGLFESNLFLRQVGSSKSFRIGTYLHVVNVVAVPGSAEELIAKSQDQDVLDHLLAQVVVDSEDLILGPVRCKRSLELSRAAKILAKRLLYLFSNRLLAFTR